MSQSFQHSLLSLWSCWDQQYQVKANLSIREPGGCKICLRGRSSSRRMDGWTECFCDSPLMMKNNKSIVMKPVSLKGPQWLALKWLWKHINCSNTAILLLSFLWVSQKLYFVHVWTVPGQSFRKLHLSFSYLYLLIPVGAGVIVILYD